MTGRKEFWGEEKYSEFSCKPGRNVEAWKKKDTDSSFDVTMGSFDGGELWELIGIYIQSLLTDSIELITKESIGLCRDDGLILLCNISSQQTDRLYEKE